jgi:type IV pilus assembly protein PilW
MSKFERGLSLIDVLVGLAVGLLVALAALGTMVSTRLTTSALDDSVRLQQRADDLFQNIGLQVAQAGAIELIDNGANTGQVSFSGAFTGYDPAVTLANGPIFAIHGIEDAGGSTDTLRISNEGKGSRRNCLGHLPNETRIDSEYSVTDGSLRCMGMGTNGPQPLAEGVEAFQVRYGVQTASAGGIETRFFNANEILDWSHIQAVSVCLQLVGETRGNPTSSTLRTDCTGAPLLNDGRIRRVYQRTFSVRNALR